MPDLNFEVLGDTALWTMGLEQFNQGEFYAAHETLEALWNRQNNPEERLLTQGILQIAVGYYHWITRQNKIGARNKLKEGYRKISQLPPILLQEKKLDLSDLVKLLPTQIQLLSEVIDSQRTLPPCSYLPQIKPIH